MRSRMKIKEISACVTNHEIESLAKCLFPSIVEYFESEEGQAEFKKYKIEQAKAKNKM